MNKKTCILTSGSGHSATRLLVRMLSQHPDVYVPLSCLNQVCEFIPLHRFFIESMDQTPLSSEEYIINEKELKFILDSYMYNIDSSKPLFVLKQPYYPLNCLSFFVNYFEKNSFLIYSSTQEKYG